MSYAEVCDAVVKLRRKYCERDPFKLCDAMGIIVIPRPLGTAPNSIKGFFLENKRIKTITVNSDLPKVIQKKSFLMNSAMRFCIVSPVYTLSMISAFLMRAPLWRRKQICSLRNFFSMISSY